MHIETNKAHLIQALALAKPAISSQLYVPALTHFAFDGWGITAYNDVSAISIAASVDLQLCLPADILSKALNSMSSENVVIQNSDEGTIMLVSGRSKIKLPFLPLDKFPFEFPTVNWEEGFILSASILKGIEKCLISVGSDPTHPAQMGVTITPDADGCTLYSTDNFTISRYKTTTKISVPGDAAIILPTFFCQQLLSLAKAFPDEEVIIAMPSGAVCANFGGQATLFTKLLVDLEPMDFRRIISKYLHGEEPEHMQDIPNGFESAMLRALLISSAELDKASRISVADGKLKLFTSSASGEATDSFAFVHKELPPFFIDPSLVSRASKACRRIDFLEDVMLLSDGGFLHLIAHCSA